VAGEWLNGWEMYCESDDVRSSPYGIRGEFLDGAVSGCEPRTGLIGPRDFNRPDEVVVGSPEEDPRRLGMAWQATACPDGATVSLLPTFDEYLVHIIATGPKCAADLEPYSVVFYLTEPLDPSLVSADIEEVLE
jgi:hypothetical protein